MRLTILGREADLKYTYSREVSTLTCLGYVQLHAWDKYNYLPGISALTSLEYVHLPTVVSTLTSLG